MLKTRTCTAECSLNLISFVTVAMTSEFIWAIGFSSLGMVIHSVNLYLPRCVGEKPFHQLISHTQYKIFLIYWIYWSLMHEKVKMSSFCFLFLFLETGNIGKQLRRRISQIRLKFKEIVCLNQVLIDIEKLWKDIFSKCYQSLFTTDLTSVARNYFER